MSRYRTGAVLGPQAPDYGVHRGLAVWLKISSGKFWNYLYRTEQARLRPFHLLFTVYLLFQGNV
jgi:hypothetical protein